MTWNNKETLSKHTIKTQSRAHSQHTVCWSTVAWWAGEKQPSRGRSLHGVSFTAFQIRVYNDGHYHCFSYIHNLFPCWDQLDVNMNIMWSFLLRSSLNIILNTFSECVEFKMLPHISFQMVWRHDFSRDNLQQHIIVKIFSKVIRSTISAACSLSQSEDKHTQL